MWWINFFNLPHPSGHTRPWGLLKSCNHILVAASWDVTSCSLAGKHSKPSLICLQLICPIMQIKVTNGKICPHSSLHGLWEQGRGFQTVFGAARKCQTLASALRKRPRILTSTYCSQHYLYYCVFSLLLNVLGLSFINLDELCLPVNLDSWRFSTLTFWGNPLLPSAHFPPWRWRHYIPSNCWHLSAKPCCSNVRFIVWNLIEGMAWATLACFMRRVEIYLSRLQANWEFLEHVREMATCVCNVSRSMSRQPHRRTVPCVVWGVWFPLQAESRIW
jgi:hypothetical protein